MEMICDWPVGDYILTVRNRPFHYLACKKQFVGTVPSSLLFILRKQAPPCYEAHVRRN